MGNSLFMGNNLNRRTFLLTTSTILSAPSLVLSSQAVENEASREFLVIWRNMTIGNSNVKVRRDQKKLRTEIDVNLVVKIFGITFYSYSLKIFTRMGWNTNISKSLPMMKEWTNWRLNSRKEITKARFCRKKNWIRNCTEILNTVSP